MHKIINKLIIKTCSVRLSGNLKNETPMWCQSKTLWWLSQKLTIIFKNSKSERFGNFTHTLKWILRSRVDHIPRDFATSLIGSVMEGVKLMVSRFSRFNFPYLEDMSQQKDLQVYCASPYTCQREVGMCYPIEPNVIGHSLVSIVCLSQVYMLM